jgi:hypothetical protein
VTADQIAFSSLCAQWVLAGGTLLLVGVGVMAFVVGVRTFWAQRVAANAARDLYNMQRRAFEPNLQWWDRLDDNDAPNAGLINAPVSV